LPSYLEDFVQKVISQNRPEKIEVKVGNKAYLVTFHPTPKTEVNISGFDISDHKELERKLQESEKNYHEIVKTAKEVDAKLKETLDHFWPFRRTS